MPTPHTPVDKGDCIASAQAFYRQATSLYKRKGIPEEFERVTSKLDEFCGEEEFEKVRVSIDWMNTCLKTYAEDRNHFCTRNTSYYCAIDPQSEGCRQNQSKLEWAAAVQLRRSVLLIAGSDADCGPGGHHDRHVFASLFVAVEGGDDRAARWLDRVNREIRDVMLSIGSKEANHGDKLPGPECHNVHSQVLRVCSKHVRDN